MWKFHKCWKCLLWYSSAMTPMLLYISSRMLLHRIRVQAHEWRNKKPFLRKLFSSQRHPRYIWISHRSYFWAYCQSIVKPLFDFCEAKLVHPAKVLTYNNYFTKPLQNQFGILRIYSFWKYIQYLKSKQNSHNTFMIADGLKRVMAMYS